MNSYVEYHRRNYNVDSDEVSDYTDIDSVEQERKVDDLRHICLECISENFQRFNTAYNTSEDPHVQQNLKFLQKFHSAHFLCEMTEDGTLDEKYLKFLVNDYLKDLEVGMLTPGCASDSIVKRMAEVGHSFVKVSFESITEETTAENIAFANSIIAHLPNVNVLRPVCHCSDETLKLISATCVNLKELCIDGSSVTDEGLQLLCRCTSLNVISLRCIQNIEMGIAHLLKNMPSLEVIDYATVPQVILSMHKEDIDNNCLDSVQGYNLTTLMLTTESNMLPVFTKLCPGVKKLSLPVKKEDVKLISSFSKLENLTAYHMAESLKYFNLDDFLMCSGGGMRELDLQEFTLSTGLLIEMCPKLEVLTLRDISFLVTEKEKEWRKLNSLRKLHFENIKFADSATQQSAAMLLSSAPRLERLDIMLCDFAGSDEIGGILAKCCAKSRVEHMTFRLCDIDEDLLTSILLSNTCLQTLTIEDCSEIGYGEIQNLNSIVYSSKNRVEIIWQHEDDSDFNSDFHHDDIFDIYSDCEDSDGWGAEYVSDCDDYDDGDDF